MIIELKNIGDIEGQPIELNGLVCHCLPQYASMTVKFMFYAGKELISHFVVPFEVFDDIDPGVDISDRTWELFEITQGYRDNVEIVLKNMEVEEKRYVVFTRLEAEK